MGADMVLFWAQWYESEVPIEELTKKIASLSEETLLMVYIDINGDNPDEELEPYWREDCKEYLLSAVEELSKVRRDCVIDYLDGSWWIFAGGMSWGDIPTQACTYISAIHISGITASPKSMFEIAT